jgi:ribosomal protein S18 acetylase RimI-like enzyme
MYVAIDPARTKGGLGASLYRWFFLWLRDHGFTRCDAHVSSDNIAAVKLHKKFPFRFVEVHGGYFLWLLPGEVA